MNNFLWNLEKSLQSELALVLYQEELSWFQKSRAQWLTDGDRNKKYYHLKTINRRRRNKIRMLKNNAGDWIEDGEDLKVLVNNFYKNLFVVEHLPGPWVQTRISFPSIHRQILDDISMEEVKKAMFGMGAWRAPGADGFPARFYQIS